MSSIKIQVNGTSTIYRQAERAVVSITVSSEGPSQDTVSKHVRTTSNSLREKLVVLNPTDPTTGHATESAPMTHFTMSSLSTWSAVPTDKDGHPLPRVHSARTSFEAKFRDFAALGSFATSLSTMAHVSITNISWRLTDATKDSLASQSRKAAFTDAIAKARDYAEVAGKEKVEVVEVMDGSHGMTANYNSHFMGAKKRAVMRSEMSVASNAEDLSFEPEGVNLNANVTVKFVAE